MIHVAILKPAYIDAILAGTKTIESRLTKTAQPPYGSIQAGERLFLKVSGGRIMATALAGEVRFIEAHGPEDIDRVYRQFGKQIGGDKEYWESKRDSRYVTLVGLREVEPINVGPVYKTAYMKAWYVLDEKLSPVSDWVITAGAIRNQYAMLPLTRGSKMRPGTRITLELPDGQSIGTDLASGGRLRWRSWGQVYDAAGARAGDVLRYVALGQNMFAISVKKQR